MEADHLRENPQTPQQQETLPAITYRLQKADAPSFSSKQSSHQTKRNNKKLPSTGFKQQPICTPLAIRSKKIIQNRMNLLFTWREEFRFHDSNSVRRLEYKSLVYRSFVQVLILFRCGVLPDSRSRYTC